MKNNQKILLIVIIALLLLLASFLLGRKSKHCPTLEDKVATEYVTKIQDVDKPYKVPNPISRLDVRPSNLIIYKDTFKFPLMKLKREHDSVMLILDTLRKTKPIPLYVLRDLNLSFDTLSLTLSNPSLINETYKYPLDLAGYCYEWQNGTLYHKKVPNVVYPTPKKVVNIGNLYASFGYDIIQKNKLIGLMYSYDIWRLRLYAIGQAAIIDKPTYYFTINLGYKLK